MARVFLKACQNKKLSNLSCCVRGLQTWLFESKPASVFLFKKKKKKIIKDDTGVGVKWEMGLMGHKMLKLIRFIIIYGYSDFLHYLQCTQRMSAALFSQSDDQQPNQYTIQLHKLHYANSMSPHTMTLSFPDAVLIISQPNIFTKTYTHWHWQGYLVRGWGANFTSYFALFVFLEIEVIINISFIWRAPPCDSRS